MQRALFDVPIFEKNSNTEKYIRQPNKSNTDANNRAFIVAVKEMVNKQPSNELQKAVVEKKDNQILAYLGEDNTEIALKVKTQNFLTKVVEECRTLSRTIHHLYLHLGSSYGKVSDAITLMIQQISTDPDLIC